MLQNPYKRTAAAFFRVTYHETHLFHVSAESNKPVSCYGDVTSFVTQKKPPAGWLGSPGADAQFFFASLIAFRVDSMPLDRNVSTSP